MKKIFLTILFLAVSLFSGSAFATTYYVRKTGNDTTGDGSSGNPWLTVYKGLTTIANTDTLKIGDGTYNEVSNPGALEKSFTMEAENMPAEGEVLKVFINCPNANADYVYCTTANRYWNIRGISFYKPNTANYRGLFRYTLNGASGTIIVSYCHFYSNNSSNKIITLYNENGQGVLKAYKCTFRKFWAGMWSGFTGSAAVDCIFTDMAYDFADSVAQAFTNNCQYNIGSPYSGSDCTSSDPGLNAADMSDYIIDSGSPCFDTGVTVATYVETYSGDYPDMGVYEVDAGGGEAGGGEGEPVEIFFL